MSRLKTIAFDLDDVLCQRDAKYDYLGPKKYQYCTPINDNIYLVNSLHDSGYKILIYTARGMSQFSGDVSLIYSELYQLTLNCLNEWGVKFDQLIMGKASYDLLIDDKCLNSVGITKENIEEFLK